MALQDLLDALGAPIIPARAWSWLSADERSRAIRLGYMPGMAGEDGEGDGGEGGQDGDEGGSDGEGSEGAGSEGSGGESGDGGSEGSGDGGSGSAGDGIDWKAMSRKHERTAKTAAKEKADLEAKLKEYQDRDKTEQEKAVEAARDEGAAKVRAEMEAERRADRLENAVLKIAGRGVKVGEDTVKFADPDDALVHLERMIAKGDIDGGDIFNDEGRVQGDALTTALAELLEAKPHLREPAANGNGGGTRKLGSADGGRGGDGGAKDLEDLSPDELYKLSKRA